MRAGEIATAGVAFSVRNGLPSLVSMATAPASRQALRRNERTKSRIIFSLFSLQVFVKITLYIKQESTKRFLGITLFLMSFPPIHKMTIPALHVCVKRDTLFPII